MIFPAVKDKPKDKAEVQLLTGVNGTGKTRLLCLLAAILGNDLHLRTRLKGNSTVNVGITNALSFSDGKYHIGPATQWSSLGFTHGGQSHYNDGVANYVATMRSQPAFAYRGVSYVSDAKIVVLAGVPRPDRPTCLSFSRPNDHSGKLLQLIANLKVSAALENMNMNGPAGEALGRATGIIRSIENAITEITGRAFLFNVKNFPEPTINVKWGPSELPFDVLPDGLRSIIGWIVDAVVMTDAWLQGNGNIRATPSFFLLDEIESHLHPIWQRRVLPAFQSLFPESQIFVATHSPFVIASLNCGWIHQLSVQASDGKVLLQPPISAHSGDSYISVIEDIMGLNEWFDQETERLLKEFREARDLAYKGSDENKTKALKLAENLAGKSAELRMVMGRELNQMERQLSSTAAK